MRDSSRAEQEVKKSDERKEQTTSCVPVWSYISWKLGRAEYMLYIRVNAIVKALQYATVTQQRTVQQRVSWKSSFSYFCACLQPQIAPFSKIKSLTSSQNKWAVKTPTQWYFGNFFKLFIDGAFFVLWLNVFLNMCSRNWWQRVDSYQTFPGRGTISNQSSLFF